MEKLFNMIGIPEHTEKREFECAVHGAFEADCLVFKSGRVFHDGCPECRRQAAESERKERDRLSSERYDILNIEPEFRGKTFSDFIPKTESQKKALDAVRRIVSERHGKVVLVGPNGVGKTLLASIAVDMLGGRLYSMYEISTMIRQSYTVKADRTELDIVRELAAVPFLFIDELGRTKGGESEQNWLSYILDKRHSRGLPFGLSGNVHFRKFCPDGGCPKCFESFFDNDILSRLYQDSAIIMVDGPDHRRINDGKEF